MASRRLASILMYRFREATIACALHPSFASYPNAKAAP
jgi:hypothetical protein